MKSPAFLLAASIVANATLLGAIALRPSLLPSSFRERFEPGAAPLASATTARPAGAASTKTIAAALPRFWSTLQSDDLPTLVARLRAAGFSPSLVRAIVSARIEARFSEQMKGLVGTVVDTPYWKADPLSGMGMGMPAFFDQMNLLYRQRSRALRDVLGDDYFASAGGDPTAIQRRQFGDLPKQKIEMVQRIADDYAELTTQIRSAMQGITLPEDREKLALLEREKHADLVALLTPQELEDYEARTSRITGAQRAAFTLMAATEDEFRKIYRIQQPFADVLYPTGGIFGQLGFEQRRQTQQEISEQLKVSLGEARYADFARASNNEFQQLSRLVQQENVPLETAVQAFGLRDVVSAESNRIYGDASLSADQKRAALQTLAQSTKAQLTATLGSAVATSYLRTASWLSRVEEGAAVTFNLGETSYRSLPRAGTAARPRN